MQGADLSFIYFLVNLKENNISLIFSFLFLIYLKIINKRVNYCNRSLIRIDTHVHTHVSKPPAFPFFYTQYSHFTSFLSCHLVFSSKK